jgi:hypothetical protein
VAGLKGDAVEELYCEVCEVDGQGEKEKKNTTEGQALETP